MKTQFPNCKMGRVILTHWTNHDKVSFNLFIPFIHSIIQPIHLEHLLCGRHHADASNQCNSERQNMPHLMTHVS